MTLAFRACPSPFAPLLCYSHPQVIICPLLTLAFCALRPAMATKRQRLLELRYTLPHMSQSVLAAVCRAAEAGGLPASVTRHTIKDARDEAASQMAPYGALNCTVEAPRLSGRPLQLELQDPLPMLYASAALPPFAKLLKESLRRKPSSPTEPWHLIMYSDEVTPGNVLAYDHKRKIVACYFSFAEFGYAVSDEEAWFCPAILRSSVVKTLAGDVTALMSSVLMRMFDPPKHDASTTRVMLDLHGGEKCRICFSS